MNKKYFAIPLFAVLALASCGQKGDDPVVVPEVDDSKVVDEEVGLKALNDSLDKTFENDLLGIKAQKTFAKVDYHEYSYDAEGKKVDKNQYGNLTEVSLSIAASGLQSTKPEDFKVAAELSTKANISVDLGLEKPITCDEVLTPKAYVANSNLYFNLESSFYSNVVSAIATSISRMFNPTAAETRVEVPTSGYIKDVVKFDEGVTPAEGLKQMVLDLFAEKEDGGTPAVPGVPVDTSEAADVLKDNVKIMKVGNTSFQAIIAYTQEAPEGHEGEGINAGVCLNFDSAKGLSSLLVRAAGKVTQTNAEYQAEQAAKGVEVEFTEAQLKENHVEASVDASVELDVSTGSSVKVNLPDLTKYEEVVVK